MAIDTRLTPRGWPREVSFEPLSANLSVLKLSSQVLCLVFPTVNPWLFCKKKEVV